MDAHILIAPGKQVAIDIEPACGDFCDRCGDCLRCYGDDPCGIDEGDHVWIVYSDQVQAFKTKHPGTLDKKD